MGFSETDVAAGKVRGYSPERRRSPRHDVPWKLVQCVGEDGARKEIFLGALVNYSERGVCLNTMKRLREGQEVTIRCGSGDRPQKAEVRWSKEVTKFFFKTGLELLGAHMVTREAYSTGPAWRP